MRTRLGKIVCALAALALLSCPLATGRAQTPCAIAGTDQTCTNATTISGNSIGISDTATLTLTNTAAGTISAVGTASSGVRAVTANVTNAGTIEANGASAAAVWADTINLTNTGTIRGIGAPWNGGYASGVGVYGIDVNVTNSGTIVGYFYGVLSTNTLNLTNSGTIQSLVYGSAVSAWNANIINTGTIMGSDSALNTSGISLESGNIMNSGTILARNGGYGIIGGLGVNVVNSGLIEATGSGSLGIAITSGSVTNSGTIRASGASSIGIYSYGTLNVTNSGTIIGETAALRFDNAWDPSQTADVLTLLPGSHIVGAIITSGGGDTINVRTGNQNLAFDTLAGATITSTTPYVVLGNQIVTVDVTSFAANWRSLTDFTRGMSDAVPVFSGGAPGGSAPLAFAGPDAPSRFDDAFASLPGLSSAYASEAAVFKAPTLTYADGTTMWARGFAGQRIQQQDGVVLRTANLFYGGMIGADFTARPDLHTGVFLGGGKTRTSIDFGLGGTDSDMLFAGAYARYDIGASFLHGAIQGGGSRNTTTRTVNNNLALNGTENAVGSFNGWYVSPELTFGHRFALGQLADATYTLTPSTRVRYLYGAFDGYTETGTSAPLTVGTQTASTVEERGEVKLTRSVAIAPMNELSTSLSGGVLGTQRVGSSTVNAALLGQAIPFATPGQANVWGYFGGSGLEWRSRNVSFFAAAEYLALTDHSNVVSGRAGLRVGF